MLCGAEDHGGGGLGARISGLTRKAKIFMSLKNTYLATYKRLYEEHCNLNKTSGI